MELEDKKEVEKCILLCSNCHTELHYYRRIFDEILKNIIQ